jgi:diaminohydroxyphosphoribosylaminopyrimidine deaminase/5-amino-6-(5-phosphoribosylamino)uracil reductase
MVELGREWEIASAMVEGGGALLGSFFDQGLVDKVVAFIAPKLIGGAEAPGPVGGRGVQAMASVLQLRDCSWQQVGDDMMVTGYVGLAGDPPISLEVPSTVLRDGSAVAGKT